MISRERERVKEMFQERKGRQLVGSSDLTIPTDQSGHLVNWWPSGVVEYRFYKTFPRSFYIHIA